MMTPFETHLPVKPIGPSVTNTPLPAALQNPLPVITPGTGMQITPIPAGGAFTVPLDQLLGGNR